MVIQDNFLFFFNNSRLQAISNDQSECWRYQQLRATVFSTFEMVCRLWKPKIHKHRSFFTLHTQNLHYINNF